MNKVSARSVDQTILRWSGGGRPTFPLSLMFVETSDTDETDVCIRTLRNTIRKMKASGYPITTDKDGRTKGNSKKRRTREQILIDRYAKEVGSV